MTALTTAPNSPPQANAVLTRIRDRARARHRRIVLPECDDQRVQEAARILAGEGLVEPVVVEPDLIAERRDTFAERYLEIRRQCDLTEEAARAAVRNPLLFASLMVAIGEADGCVAGCATTTAATVRAALHGIGPAKGVTSVSGCFLMVFPSTEVGAGGALVAALGEHPPGRGQHRRRLLVVIGCGRSGHRPTVCPLAAPVAGIRAVDPYPACTAVRQARSTMSLTEQPRDRSFIGRARPWSSGPMAAAPPRRWASL